MTTYLLIALLHVFTYRSPVQAEWDGDSLVKAVYRVSVLDGVAVVSMESWFNPFAERREPRGHTSFGLFQIDDEWHPQYRENLTQHIAYGSDLLGKLKEGHGLAAAVSHYNGGTNPGGYSVRWGAKVEARRDSLALYVYRHLR